VLLPADVAALLGPAGVRRLAAELPVRDTVTVRTAIQTAASTFDRLPEGGTDSAMLAALEQRGVAVGGAETIRVVTGRAATAGELAILDQGGAVLFNDTVAVGDRVTLTSAAGAAAPLPAVVASHGEYFTRMPGLVIAPATAQRLGLRVEPSVLVVDTTRAPTRAELAAANDVLLRAQLDAATPPAAPVTVTPVRANPLGSRTDAMFYLLAGISGVVTLIASTVAVGLAAAELRGDLATMAAVGATPGNRRRINAAQAAVIVSTGAVLGLAAGIGPAAGYIGYSANVQWRAPWLALALIVVVPPVLATVLIGLLGRGRLPLTRRTA
jgi:putative ABC transport system permease protein